ncbi:hypothetical protein NC00_04545 [Xanthomonas cannabis pv. phaseoli]|uniref:Uncharacterized protein n=1 Tax=Xanthomonas cannabis pv. phaseoli TaxID=1885902 RepID=A0AB34PBY2_9XANT|nr:hypothetical protein NC00_04545 [Xanthomonas cannabis pv. phaseoli]
MPWESEKSEVRVCRGKEVRPDGFRRTALRPGDQVPRWASPGRAGHRHEVTVDPSQGAEDAAACRLPARPGPPGGERGCRAQPSSGVRVFSCSAWIAPPISSPRVA